jgi:hypothetical protein
MRCKLGSWAGVVVAVVLAALVIAVGPASANRCSTGLISGGKKSECPSVDDPDIPSCPPGSTRVVYRLDKPFPVDGKTLSSALITSTRGSDCGGADVSVGLTSDSYAIACWSPPDPLGCRTVKMLSNGSLCLHLAAKPLGCGGAACENLSIEQVAISNAGAADRQICPPRDTTNSCRSTRRNGGEGFRIIFGGLCSTMNLTGGDTENACVAAWGAWGTFKARDHYDWESGAFRFDVVRGRSTCGALGECLGDGQQAPWKFTIIGVPDDQIPGNVPPCVNDPGGGCQATSCFH